MIIKELKNKVKSQLLHLAEGVISPTQAVLNIDNRYKDGVIFNKKYETFLFLRFGVFIIKHKKSKGCTVILDKEEIIRIEVFK